jgi:hypothetical protein
MSKDAEEYREEDHWSAIKMLTDFREKRENIIRLKVGINSYPPSDRQHLRVVEEKTQKKETRS